MWFPELVHAEQVRSERCRLQAVAGRPDAVGRRFVAHRAGRVLRGRGERCARRQRDANRSATDVLGRVARVPPGRRRQFGVQRRRRAARVSGNTVRGVLCGGRHVPGRHASHIRVVARASRHRPLGQSDRPHRLPVCVVRHPGRHHARSRRVQLLRLCRRR